MHNNIYKEITVLLAFALIMFIISTFTFYNKAITNEELFQYTKEELDIASEHLESEAARSELLTVELEHVNDLLNETNSKLADFKNTEYEFKYIGDFALTHYCTEKFKHICGTGTGLTAMGTQVTAGHTIAVDPHVIPYGSQVYIEGYGFRTAEDCGGAVHGNHIDIAVDTHSEALDYGLRHGGVWVLVEKNS